MAKTALVTGANRGIGREVAAQLGALGYWVFIGARDPSSADETRHDVEGGGGRPTVVELDISDLGSVQRAAAAVAAETSTLDCLVNNAAITYDTWQTAIGADLSEVRTALDTNVFGTWQITQALSGLLRASSEPRVVNVSSGAGSLAEMGGSLPAYRVSKVAMSALTRMWAAELAADGVLVNAVCPGWVATDMGGAGGRPVSEGAAGVVWAATLGDGGPTGGFFRDGEPVDW